MRLLSGLVLILVAALALIGVLRIAAPPPPAIRLIMNCDATPEKPELQRIVDFAEAHEGEVAYVEFGIEATTHVGSCEFEGAADRAEGRPPASLSRVSGGGRWQRDGFVLEVTTPFEAGVMALALPDTDAMAVDGLYIRYGDFYRYYLAGPVVLRHDTGNGFVGASLSPVAGSAALHRVVACGRRALDWPAGLGRFLPCW